MNTALFWTVYTTLLIIPGVVFLDQRGSGFLEGADLQSSFRLLFPFFGLYAFSLVALQASIGSNLRWLQRAVPVSVRLHKFQGLFALLFAFTHPLMILAGYGVASYLKYEFVSPTLVVFVLPAYAALAILTITVLTAFLAWRGVPVTWWRVVHRLNYLAFALVWIHSWFIGSDVQTTPLKYVWLFYAGLVAFGLLHRYVITRPVSATHA